LLASCDRTRAVGLRDYAILLALARWGLRCAELAALTVDDVDWHHGEITVRGKRNVVEPMPLPADVGQALVDYLINGRPRTRTSSRNLFLRIRAPRQAMAPCAVGAVVHDASVRAGLPKLITAHQLRHSLGTDLLRAGASLPEVAQVLRQRHLSSTVIYTKVDHAALRELVTLWPGALA
jgi:site-specific recombinase XerD